MFKVNNKYLIEISTEKQESSLLLALTTTLDTVLQCSTCCTTHFIFHLTTDFTSDGDGKQWFKHQGDNMFYLCSSTKNLEVLHSCRISVFLLVFRGILLFLLSLQTNHNCTIKIQDSTIRQQFKCESRELKSKLWFSFLLKH